MKRLSELSGLFRRGEGMEMTNRFARGHSHWHWFYNLLNPNIIANTSYSTVFPAVHRSSSSPCCCRPSWPWWMAVWWIWHIITTRMAELRRSTRGSNTKTASKDGGPCTLKYGRYTPQRPLSVDENGQVRPVWLYFSTQNRLNLLMTVLSTGRF